MGPFGSLVLGTALSFCYLEGRPVMPALSLRAIPQDVYNGLKAMAARNRRSMQEQARLLLEREVRLHQPAAMERARQWRERMRQRPMPHLLEDLRSDRDR